MSHSAELERRYRRLLAWYPRVYWRDHEEEMLAVLLSGAQAGQVRPRIGEAASMLWHATRTRLGQHQMYPHDRGSDAMAMFSVAAPIVMLGPTLLTLLNGLFTIRLDIGPYLPVILAAPGQLAITAAVLLRLRRTALLLAVLLVGWMLLGIFAHSAHFIAPQLGAEEFLLTYYLLEGAALALSPGPRRGLPLLRGRPAAVITVATVFTAAWVLSHQLYQSRQSVEGLLAAMAVLCVMAVAGALTSRTWRYVAILFLIMMYAYALYLGQRTGHLQLPPSLGPAILLYLPALLAACAAFATAKRRQTKAA